MIKAVFFDIDNTLLSFDGYVKEAMRTGFEKFDLPPYEEGMFAVFTRVNNALWRRIEDGTLTFPELLKIRWNRIFEALGIRADGEAFEDYFRAALFESAVLIDGVHEILSALRGKYILCAASNGPLAQQLNRLKIGGLDGFFTDIFISEEIGFQKLSPAFFSACLSRLREKTGTQLAPHEILIVGDSPTSDVEGGRNAGFATCLFDPDGVYPATFGEPPAPDASPSPADFTIRTLSELLQILPPAV